MALTTVQNGMLTTDPLNATNITSGTLPFARLPTGSVLQVVQGQTSGLFFGSSTTFANVIGASITPKFTTSKILVFISVNGAGKTSSANGALRLALYKNSSILQEFTDNFGYSGTSLQVNAAASHQYLDSPATTSAVTYALYYASATVGDNVWVNNYKTTATACKTTIILMEIAG